MMRQLNMMMEGKNFIKKFRIYIDPSQYANHFLGALLTQSFDYIITNYSMILNE